MSQAKVDAHKESKKHVKEEMAKKKRRHILVIVILIIVAAVIVGWVSYSGYKTYQENKGIEHIEVNTNAISDYTTGL
ncbi:MAG: hypothetical protein LUC41_05085 [Clostridiales bacterium]|nr:hypothetical protein [Clostridiales bacterium]